MADVAIYARKSTESEDRQILSIDSQIRELKEFATREGLEVSGVFTESKSAKAPGRPVFNDLFARIQKGAIDRVICWKLDRLARNPVDGGAMIWAMDEQKLKAIYTPQHVFVNTGNDKFIMQIELGMAKKYIDDLSDNVKRGIRARLAQGWVSGRSPLGYLNDRTEKRVVKDPDRFPLVRKMWDMLLTENYSPPHILKTATDNWGLRTRGFKRTGGGPLTLTSIYRLFQNPFYYGALRHNGEFHVGKQEPMISKSEFDRAQRVLSRTNTPRPQEYAFAYTGILRCGECGCSITAEHKVNRQGHRYVYYHCTRRKPGVHCSQKAIEVKDLESQVRSFLDSITISEGLKEWAIQRVIELNNEESAKDQTGFESLNRRLSACKREQTELVNLRLRGMLTDDEFLSKKKELEDERFRITELLQDSDSHFTNVLDRCSEVFDFALKAKGLFERSDPEARRAILRFAGSNLTLRDKTLTITPQKPLFFVQRALESPLVRKSMFEPAFLSEPSQSKAFETRYKNKWQSLVHEVRTFFLQNPGSPSYQIKPLELNLKVQS